MVDSLDDLTYVLRVFAYGRAAEFLDDPTAGEVFLGGACYSFRLMCESVHCGCCGGVMCETFKL